MNPARFSIANSALVNAIVIMIIVTGAYSLIALMPREFQPEIGFNWGFVITYYPGASPEEIERLVSIPIEDELSTLEDVDVLTSQSESGKSFVWVKFEQIPQRTFDRRLDDIRARVQAADLPDEVEDPIIQDFTSYDFQPVLQVALAGDLSEQLLHDEGLELERRLSKIDGVGRIEVYGDRERQVNIDCDPARLQAYELSFAELSRTISGANRNLPAGTLDLSGESYLLRTRGRFTEAADVAEVPLRSGPGGRRLRLDELCAVADGFADRTVVNRFGGERAILFSVIKNERGNTLDISADIRALLAEMSPRLPEGMRTQVFTDESLAVSDLLSVLGRNTIGGLILVILVLLVFIGPRGALIAALGIPVTFLLALFILYVTGHSLNGSTLFGLILVIGMVVDDAIVILENCYRHLEMGKNVRDAAIDGAREVVAPVTISTLTTMAGFLPLVLMPGTMGKFMRIIPITVSLVLFASLVEAFWILPSHFVDIAKQTRDGGGRLLHSAQDYYEGLLRRMLRARYLVMGGSAAALLASIFVVPLLGVELFAGDEISVFSVLINMPDGTSLEATEEVVERFEAVAMELPSFEVIAVNATIGLQQRTDDWINASHLGQVTLDLVEASARERSVDEIVADMRIKVAEINGPASVEFQKTEGGPPGEPPVNILIKGPELEAVDEVAELLMARLAELPGVTDIKDDLDLAQPRLDLVIDRAAAARRGLDSAAIAFEIQAAFAGHTATRFRSAREEIDVVVRLAEDYRGSREDILSTEIVVPGAGRVPLSSVARLVEGRSPLTIRRRDGERNVTLTAEVDPKILDARQVNENLQSYFAELAPTFPGIELEPGGEFREFTEAFQSLGLLFGFGLMLNFMLLSGQFKNWAQPLLILAVVPLSFIGAIGGLMVARAPFSITTLYGFVALAGVAVNDSIVLVAFINELRQRGHGISESLVEAGRLRLRPIILTSVTTIFGLMPMALGLGGASKTWQPLATTICAGLAVATVICLLVIPCMQAILDDLAKLIGHRPLGTRGHATGIDEETSALPEPA